MMVEGFVLWKSVKQIPTTSFTMEAEYVACYEATCHAIWLQNFISALGGGGGGGGGGGRSLHF